MVVSFRHNMTNNRCEDDSRKINITCSEGLVEVEKSVGVIVIAASRTSWTDIENEVRLLLIHCIIIIINLNIISISIQNSQGYSSRGALIGRRRRRQ